MTHVKGKHPFKMIAYAWMPDHIHAMWQLPENDADFPLRWRLIKHFMTRRARTQEIIWQKRYWEHWIHDQDDYNRHLDYVHINPVKHGYVNAPEQWTYSSYHYYLEQKIYSAGWGRIALDINGEFGE